MLDEDGHLSELTSDEIDKWMALLRDKYGRRISGLQDSVLGQCRKGTSLPKFRPVGRHRFVQILNVNDHWVCVTSLFGETTHDVYVYDSLFTGLNHSLIVQVSSLLRADTSKDEVIFHIRSFKQQKRGTRTCGFYAAAAAVDCCMKADPTGHIYEESMLSRQFKSSLTSGKPAKFLTKGIVKGTEEIRKTVKRHCVCHGQSKGQMIQCSKCFSWFHAVCVGLRAMDIRKMGKVIWACPCCNHKEPESVDTVLLD